MLNGVTQLVITKIDVMDKFDTVSIGTHYSIDGEKTNALPYDLCDKDITPIYEEHAGWKTDLTSTTAYEELPLTAKSYVYRLEELLEVPISIVSTGPNRKQLIHK